MNQRIVYRAYKDGVGKPGLDAPMPSQTWINVARLETPSGNKLLKVDRLKALGWKVTRVVVAKYQPQKVEPVQPAETLNLWQRFTRWLTGGW